MGGLGNPIHLAFIAIIALIFLGPKRLPDLAKSLGTGMREFRETLSGAQHEPEPPIVAAVEAPAPVPEVAPAVAPAVPSVTPPVAPPVAPDAS